MARRAVLHVIQPEESDEPAPGTHDRRAMYAANRAQLAWCFGVSAGQVHQWAEDGAPAKEARGYNVREWVAWRIEFIKRQSATHESKRRYDEARAGVEEEKLKRLRGEVIAREQSTADRLAIVRWFSDVLDRLPSELVTKLAGDRKKNRRVLKSYINGLRGRLAEPDA